MESYITKKFEERQLVEVQVRKLPCSILNNFVMQYGKIVQFPQNGFVHVKLESRKIVRFPVKHLNIIHRFSRNGKVSEEFLSSFHFPEEEEDQFHDIDDSDDDNCDYPDHLEEDGYEYDDFAY